MPFNWDGTFDPKKLRLGYLKSAFDNETREECIANNAATLEALRSMGFDLVPVELPESRLNFFIEYVERAAGFDEFARSHQDEGLVRTRHRAELRVHHLVPAVEYLQANRIRRLLMEETDRSLADVDVFVAPQASLDPKISCNPLTSMTGHPTVAVPNGSTSKETPTGTTFTGRLFREAEMLAVAKAYQDATGFHLKHPVL